MRVSSQKMVISFSDVCVEARMRWLLESIIWSDMCGRSFNMLSSFLPDKWVADRVLESLLKTLDGELH